MIPIRSLHAFDTFSDAFDLMTLGVASRIAWSAVVLVGFAATGYVYAARSDDDARRALAVAVVAALVGVLVGNLGMALSTDVFWGDTPASNLVVVATYSALDAGTFALVVLGGYALAVDGEVRATP